MTKQKAFILFGGIYAAKYPRFIHYLREREFLVCIIDEDTERSRLRLACRNSNERHVFHKAREIVLVDPADLHAIVRQVNEWRKEYTIGGVYTIREHFVTQAAIIADFLNLPGPGLRAGHVCRNKFLQRTYLEDWSPPFITVNPAATHSRFDTFPAVLKPTGRQASSGVVSVDSFDEALRELPNYGANEQVLLEAFVAGDEFSVESLVQGGEIVFRNATLKRTNHLHSRQFVELAHTLPAPNVPEGRLTRLYEANRDVVRRLGFQDGVSHAEFKITPEGQVFLMEVAARNPGDGIMPLYQLATGKPLEEALIRIALQEPAAYPEPTRMARQVYFEHPNGRLKDVHLEGFPLSPTFFFDTGMRAALDCSTRDEPATLREVTVERQRGELLEDIRQSRDRCGYFLMDGVDVAALDKLETEVLQNITVTTD
jgi:biotin carboxylase